MVGGLINVAINNWCSAIFVCGIARGHSNLGILQFPQRIEKDGSRLHDAHAQSL